MTNTKPFDLIPESILAYWRAKYGEYLMAYESTDCIIYCENGIIGCFHPSGDRLARHHKPSGKTIYIWNNNVKEPLTEKEYMDKLFDQEEISWKLF